jgi:hypothetical protein
MGLAFLCFIPLASISAVPALLVMVILGVFAVSELLLSPIGLSVTTKLAPDAFRAQMMALYFFSVGLGTSMSGVLSKYYDRLARSATSASSVRSPWPRVWSCSSSRRGSAVRWRACTDRPRMVLVNTFRCSTAWRCASSRSRA